MILIFIKEINISLLRDVVNLFRVH